MTATRPRPRRQRIGQDVEGRRDRVLPGRAPPSRDDASILAWTASSATEALGRVIRAAEWMGAGDRRQPHRAEPVNSPQPTAGSGAAKEENGRGAPSLAAESPPRRRPSRRWRHRSRPSRPHTTVELRFTVDATEAPLVYPDAVEDLAVELAGPGQRATLVLPIDKARSWAGELFAVAVAYREATGNPHALATSSWPPCRRRRV